MRYLRIAALCVALLFVFAQADAQGPTWTWTSVTANSGTVILPYANSPTFNGTAIVAGDWIGGFGTDNGFCVGAVLWEMNPPPQLANGLTVWGDDDQTTVVDGLVAGEIIQYKLWRQETGLEYFADEVTYSAGSSNTTGAYLFNGVWVIGSMAFEDVPPGYTVSGVLTYAKTTLTPMINVNIALVSGELIIAETTTNENGEYTFTNVPNGEYHIAANTDKTWGGLNAADAILIKRHMVGVITLNAIQQLAGDVNVSNSITATDAILIQRKIVGTATPQWIVPDWVFETPQVVVDGADVLQVNFQSLCGGDVNGSRTAPF